MSTFVSLAGLNHVLNYSIDVTPMPNSPNMGMYVLQINFTPNVYVVQLPTMDAGDNLPLMNSINIITKSDSGASPTPTVTAYLGVDVIPAEGIEKEIDINFWELNPEDPNPVSFVHTDSDMPAVALVRKNPKKVVFKRPVPSIIIRVIRAIIKFISKLLGINK